MSQKSEAARILGKIKTRRKAESSRRNGRLGGRPNNNHKKNLEWCTWRENLIHSIKVLGRIRNTKKQRQSAVKVGKSKRLLTMNQAECIRCSCLPRKKLAELYSVSLPVIDRIINRKSYI